MDLLTAESSTADLVAESSTAESLMAVSVAESFTVDSVVLLVDSLMADSVELVLAVAVLLLVDSVAAY